MADIKDKVKFRKFVNNEREALALDKVDFDSSTNTLTMYSSFDPTIKEETTIPISNVELDTALEQSGKAADAKATGDAVRAVRAMIGTPLTSNQASGMTDVSKIYVYTGNEEGYQTGHWYYYNGTSWVDGGVYNSSAIDTDKTLSIENMPADAKKTGDEIDSLKSDLSDLDAELKYELAHITVEVDSTLTNENMPADAKAVGDKILATKEEIETEIYDNVIKYPQDTDGDKIFPISEKMLTVKADGSSDYEDIPTGNVARDLLFDSYSEDDSKTKVNITINTSGTPATGEVKGLRSTATILTGDGSVGSVNLRDDNYLQYTSLGTTMVIPVISGHKYAFVAKTPKQEDGWYNFTGMFFSTGFDFTFTVPYMPIPETGGSREATGSDYSDGGGKIFTGAKVTVPTGMNYIVIQSGWLISDSSQESGFREFEVYDYTEYPINATYDKIVEDPVIGDTYKISYALIKASSSNTSVSIDGSNQYKTTITAETGKIISSCTVKIGNTVYNAKDGAITINNANSNIKISAASEALPDDTYVGAYSVKRQLIPQDLLDEKLDTPKGISSAEVGQMLYSDGTGGISIGDAPFVPNCKISMDWQDVYGFWTSGYFYDPTNNYAYTQIPAGDTLWTETELRLGVSCTPYNNLINVSQGERYRYRNTQIHHDRLNMYLPGVYIFDSNKSVIQTIEGGGEYKEFVIPKNGVYMAVLYYNAQSNYSLQRYDVVGFSKKDMLTAVQANYRTYLCTTPPTMQPLDKVYFCIGADDLRPWQTKKIHDYLTSKNLRYYMAAIPEAVKAAVHDDPYKTNYDYMVMCVENGGEIVVHSDEWIQSSNIDDLDMLYRYFYLHKKELEFYGFTPHGIFLAGGDGAISVDERINSWATYLYDYSDAFGYHFPYNFLGRGNKILEYMSPSQVDSVITQAFEEHSFACFLLHELNDTARTAIDHMMETLGTYERGVDYEFITPYELYKKLMPTQN